MEKKRPSSEEGSIFARRLYTILSIMTGISVVLFEPRNAISLANWKWYLFFSAAYFVLVTVVLVIAYTWKGKGAFENRPLATVICIIYYGVILGGLYVH